MFSTKSTRKPPSETIHFIHTSFTLTIPKARAFLEDTSTPPTPPHQDNNIDEPFIDTFMEHIRNNEPSTPDSSDQTINISYDTDKEPEPKLITDPKEIDDLVWQFESEANEHLPSVTQDFT